MASSAKKTSQKFAKTKRSDDKTRSTRCLLQCSSMRRHEEICKVFQWEDNFYEFLCLCVRRHLDNGGNPSGDPGESRLHYLLNPTFRVCDQHRKIATRTKYRNSISRCKFDSISRCKNKLVKYDYAPTRIKDNKINKPLREPLKKKNVSLKELKSLVGKLISTYQTVLPAPLPCWSLEMPQILKLRENYYYEDRVELNPGALKELKRWCNNLKLKTGKYIQLQNPDIVTQSNAVKL